MGVESHKLTEFESERMRKFREEFGIDEKLARRLFAYFNVLCLEQFQKWRKAKSRKRACVCATSVKPGEKLAIIRSDGGSLTVRPIVVGPFPSDTADFKVDRVILMSANREVLGYYAKKG